MHIITLYADYAITFEVLATLKMLIGTHYKGRHCTIHNSVTQSALINHYWFTKCLYVLRRITNILLILKL